MSRDKIKFLFGAIILTLFFGFLLAGVWASSFYLAVKLALTGFLVLAGGSAAYFGLEAFWKFVGETADL